MIFGSANEPNNSFLRDLHRVSYRFIPSFLSLSLPLLPISILALNVVLVLTIRVRDRWQELSWFRGIIRTRWKRRNATFTSDIGRSESPLPLCRVHITQKPAETSILCNLVKIVPVLCPFAVVHTTPSSISHDPTRRWHRKLENPSRIVAAVHVTLIRWDHKRSLYKFHPLYEILCAREI